MAETQSVDERLDNWAIWARSDEGMQRSRCMSLEGRYVPPPYEHDDKRVIRLEYDFRDAIVVEKAICKLPEQFKGVIKAEYCLKHLLRNGKYFHTCRRLKINPKRFDETLKQAKFALKNRL